MHYLPDTDDQDAIAERYWPDGFKGVIRNGLSRALSITLTPQNLRRIYQRHFSGSYPDVDAFAETVLNSTIIGAENGADRGFEAVYSAFLAETRLPCLYRYALHPWPDVMSASLQRKIQLAVVKDYSADDGFRYAYKDGYLRDYVNHADFIDAVADIIVVCTANGVDDTLERIYTAFIHGHPLPPMRRNPRRLKTW
ncbi:MAG: hypothetical protein PHO26_02200 [Dehalococcoidia bacterium]|nr:hypothetical protein [Dehalococcoidia bacterium]MDD5494587.1 hypothetical protein [Dehalococcoidia bacterium]